MFLKINVGKHFNNVKNFIGHGYHHGKRFLGHLDNADRTGAEIYIKNRACFKTRGARDNRTCK